MRPCHVFAGLGFALSLTGCSDGSTENSGPQLTASVAPTSITAGATATVTANVTGFTLRNPATNTVNVAGEGHYHVYLDAATGGSYLAVGSSSSTSITIPANATPGAHTLRVQLANNDYSALSPNVQVILPITVQ